MAKTTKSGRFQVIRDDGHLKLQHIATGLYAGAFSHLAVRTFKAAIAGVEAVEERVGERELALMRNGWEIVITADDGDLPDPASWIIGVYPAGDWNDPAFTALCSEHVTPTAEKLSEAVEHALTFTSRPTSEYLFTEGRFDGDPDPAPEFDQEGEGWPVGGHPLAGVRAEARKHREQARAGLAASSRTLDDLRARLGGSVDLGDRELLLQAVLDTLDIVAAHQYALAAEFHVN